MVVEAVGGPREESVAGSTGPAWVGRPLGEVGGAVAPHWRVRETLQGGREETDPSPSLHGGHPLPEASRRLPTPPGSMTPPGHQRGAPPVRPDRTTERQAGTHGSLLQQDHDSLYSAISSGGEAREGRAAAPNAPRRPRAG
ncbi:hypothetical protein E2C01_040531 [Portunus trituberculatus]|uniref:Uncharacterized protein n=1 Tax=Portunus trituberculatus TaxID=210409 RepID=A0A5B7FP10_PORTR|nr:hypothetical protein [Portunus trituberculatus]